MIQNIKAMYRAMDKQNKELAIDKIKSILEIESTTYIKQTLIWGGGLNESQQEKVVPLFQEILKKQGLLVKPT